MFDQSGSQGSDGEERSFDASSRHARFPTTDWSEIGKLLATQPEIAKQAFNEWLQRYTPPLVAFFRSKGYQSHDACDLAQDLVTHLYEKEKFRQIKPNTHLRRWLLTIANNWLKDDYRKRNADKRKPTEGAASIGRIANSSDADLPVIDPKNPEAAFNASWRMEVLSGAFETTRAECERQHRGQDFELFLRYYVAPLEAAPGDETAQKPTWSELAEEFGLESARVASGKADWVKIKFRDAVKLEIRRYVSTEDEVEDELRELLGGDGGA